MGGGRDRDELGHRVEAGLAQRLDDVGEAARVDGAHVEVDARLAAAVHDGADRARHVVARRQLVDEALAVGVVQRRALAADGLGDEEALAARRCR